jgi:hypothetical protein
MIALEAVQCRLAMSKYGKLRETHSNDDGWRGDCAVFEGCAWALGEGLRVANVFGNQHGVWEGQGWLGTSIGQTRSVRQDLMTFHILHLSSA